MDRGKPSTPLILRVAFFVNVLVTTHVCQFLSAAVSGFELLTCRLNGKLLVPRRTGCVCQTFDLQLRFSWSQNSLKGFEPAAPGTTIVFINGANWVTLTWPRLSACRLFRLTSFKTLWKVRKPKTFGPSGKCSHRLEFWTPALSQVSHLRAFKHKLTINRRQEWWKANVMFY